MKTLPEKLSELILVALADLEKVESDTRYKINMSTWHSGGYEDEPCEVCLAGCVMARTLEVPVSESKEFWDFESPLSEKLAALDEVRSGDIASALIDMGASDEDIDAAESDGLRNFIDVTSYYDNPTLFKQQLREIAETLKTHGL